MARPELVMYSSVAALMAVLWLGREEARAQQPPAPPAARPGGPVNNMRDMWPALTACWKPPAHTKGMEVTVNFALKRNGEVLGKPRITYSKLNGDPEVGRVFVASVLSALAQCTPLKLSDSFGGAVAGRIFSIRFASPLDRA
jgi:hypothetical protein